MSGPDGPTIHACNGITTMIRPSALAPWLLSILLGIGWISVAGSDRPEVPPDERERSDWQAASDSYTLLRSTARQRAVEALPEAGGFPQSAFGTAAVVPLQARLSAGSIAREPIRDVFDRAHRSIHDGRSPPARAPPSLIG